jgi:hypothetical protein
MCERVQMSIPVWAQPRAIGRRPYQPPAPQTDRSSAPGRVAGAIGDRIRGNGASGHGRLSHERKGPAPRSRLDLPRFVTRGLSVDCCCAIDWRWMRVAPGDSSGIHSLGSGRRCSTLVGALGQCGLAGCRQRSRTVESPGWGAAEVGGGNGQHPRCADGVCARACGFVDLSGGGSVRVVCCRRFGWSAE